MIVEAVAGVVVEHTLSIAVGTAAVIVAPKVAPQLAKAARNAAVNSAKSVAKNAQQAGSNVIVSTRSAGGAVLTSVRTTPAKPVTETGQAVFATAAHGLQRYGEEWEDILAEAHEMRYASGAGMRVREVLESLGEAKVVSQLPGRVRLRVGLLEGQGALAQRVAETFERMDGINMVQTSALTGSVLIFYDTDQYPSLAALLQAASSS